MRPEHQIGPGIHCRVADGALVLGELGAPRDTPMHGDHQQVHGRPHLRDVLSQGSQIVWIRRRAHGGRRAGHLQHAWSRLIRSGDPYRGYSGRIGTGGVPEWPEHRGIGQESKAEAAPLDHGRAVSFVPVTPRAGVRDAVGVQDR